MAAGRRAAGLDFAASSQQPCHRRHPKAPGTVKLVKLVKLAKLAKLSRRHSPRPSAALRAVPASTARLAASLAMSDSLTERAQCAEPGTAGVSVPGAPRRTRGRRRGRRGQQMAPRLKNRQRRNLGAGPCGLPPVQSRARDPVMIHPGQFARQARTCFESNVAIHRPLFFPPFCSSAARPDAASGRSHYASSASSRRETRAPGTAAGRRLAVIRRGGSHHLGQPRNSSGAPRPATLQDRDWPVVAIFCYFGSAEALLAAAGRWLSPHWADGTPPDPGGTMAHPPCAATAATAAAATTATTATARYTAACPDTVGQASWPRDPGLRTPPVERAARRFRSAPEGGQSIGPVLARPNHAPREPQPHCPWPMALCRSTERPASITAPLTPLRPSAHVSGRRLGLATAAATAATGDKQVRLRAALAHARLLHGLMAWPHVGCCCCYCCCVVAAAHPSEPVTLHGKTACLLAMLACSLAACCCFCCSPASCREADADLQGEP
ncbi:hypothetical protein BS50DRAFT_667534 [Corynespora cassiicola Philippines]|uniref:Uncharacterized protein n=1 Tax=Corynespora cassiicola Philippines TaxID=1448308 RepID=A0A2T2NPN2_CORCC|nr:hypothetical protein BS50DRAFT_667534 [Corynespora cassiicola Philippines]